DAYAIRDAAGDLVGGHTWGSPSEDLFLTYADEGARVFIPEADGIWGDGFSYARGSIEFDLASCGGADGCIENVVARLGWRTTSTGSARSPRRGRWRRSRRRPSPLEPSRCTRSCTMGSGTTAPVTSPTVPVTRPTSGTTVSRAPTGTGG